MQTSRRVLNSNSIGALCPSSHTADAPGSTSTSLPQLLEDSSPSGLPGLPGSGSEPKALPDDAILFMLRREALLTKAKLHYLVFEHLTQEKELRILKQALRQVGPLPQQFLCTCARSCSTACVNRRRPSLFGVPCQQLSCAIVGSG